MTNKIDERAGKEKTKIAAQKFIANQNQVKSNISKNISNKAYKECSMAVDTSRRAIGKELSLGELTGVLKKLSSRSSLSDVKDENKFRAATGMTSRDFKKR